MSKIICIFLFLFTSLYASIEIDDSTQQIKVLSKSEIYIDYTNSLNIKEIKKKSFEKNNKSSLAYGYSPSFTLWIKFTIKNNSNRAIEKILQYEHETTSEVWFFDGKLVKKRGFEYITNKEFALSPTFILKFKPNEIKTFYIKAYSEKSFLTAKLSLWDIEKFYNHQSNHQFILALFFGALGLLIVYNFFIFFSVKDKSYLWYVLYLSFILANLFFYKGLFYKFYIESFDDFLKVYRITFPISILILTLFIQSFLSTKQYPKINKGLYLFFFPLVFIIIINFVDGFKLLGLSINYAYIVILYIFFVICYSAYKKHRQAYFILPGWLIMLMATTMVYLSLEGVFNFLDYYPYIIETGVFLEAILFSFALADRIKVLQRKLFEQQQNEKQRLKNEVELKTKDLNLALNEKEILLQELLHRIKNNMQFIISLYALKLEGVKENEIPEKMKDVERKVLAMSQVHQMLYNQKNIHNIEATEYFKKIVQTIKDSFDLQGILFNYKIEAKLEMEEAIYCGLIVNELVTNAVKYAFLDKKGEINIELIEDEKYKYLSVEDNGIGLKKDIKTGFGKVMIDALAINQLKGAIKIENNNGTKIKIQFPKK